MVQGSGSVKMIHSFRPVFSPKTVKRQIWETASAKTYEARGACGFGAAFGIGANTIAL